MARDFLWGRNAMKYVKPALLVGIALFCPGLEAGPAAWYKWRSVESDIDICSQISPGDGWVAVKGPFQDAVCKKQGVPR